MPVLVLGLTLSPCFEARAEPPRDRWSEYIDELVEAYEDSEGPGVYRALAENAEDLLAAALGVKVASEWRTIDLQRVHRLEMARTDKQLGATSTSSASTSATEKPGVAWLLGLAVESGAINQKEDKTGVTLSTSPYAFLTLGVDDTPDRYEAYDWARRLGISATFPLDSGGDAEDRNFDPSSLT